jgi:hypothetical protein
MENDKMPISALDPKTALLVVDLQKGIVGLPTVHPSRPRRAIVLGSRHARRLDRSHS